MQASKQKPKYTVRTVFEELKNLAEVHRKAERGYRAVLRTLMGRAATILVRIDNSAEAVLMPER